MSFLPSTEISVLSTETLTTPEDALRVLVVDDNEPLATTLGWLLEEMGYDICICNKGEEALAMTKTFRPDVVILDIGMPVMNGFEVCTALRADPEHSHIRIICQSGYGDAETLRKSAEVGFDEHLLKPVEFATLANILASHRPKSVHS